VARVLHAPRMPTSRWRTDLCWVAAATLGCYLIAAALDLQESLTHRLARFETWNADEVPLSLLALACGLIWFATRRRRELQAQLDLREMAEARIADLLAHKRELAQQLISLQESERRALARELHDELGQNCTAIRVETALLRHCAADDRAGMLAAAGRADAAAQELQQLVNQMLRRLRPANLDTLGLGAALQELCESWSERSGVNCSFRSEGSTEALDDTVDITIYRVTQEALTNVVRHARARSVDVALLRVSGTEVVLRVQDDGQGMDPGLATRGLGLLGAGERAAAVGGALQVHSAPGRGLTLELRIPLPLAVPLVVPPPPLSSEAAFREAA
jgi:signal transduction histidine kinase